VGSFLYIEGLLATMAPICMALSLNAILLSYVIEYSG